ncbi:GTPase IMAP family member 7-like [Fundulus diaphanus]
MGFCCGSKVPELRVVVIGSIAANKSEVIQQIVESQTPDNPHETKVSVGCCTPKAKGCPVNIEGCDMVLFDPPGLCDPNCTEDVMKEIQRCVTKSARHVFLFVLEIGRYTRGQRKMVESIKSTFGESVTENMIIVFKGTVLKHERRDIREAVAEEKDLHSFFVDCSERYLEFYEDEPKEFAVRKIKLHIDDIIKESQGTCYSHKMMMMAQSPEEGNEKLSLPVKICLLMGIWLGAGIGFFLFGKDFLEAGGVFGGGLGGIAGMVSSAMSKRIKDRI